LTARRSKKRFSVGDELRVFVSRVDRFKRQIDFALADQPKRALSRERQPQGQGPRQPQRQRR
jgi:hypothetical protein